MLEVKVCGEFACFTRPEHKVERVSYDVITPSAARGVLEAIFWKPEFSWQVREIWVLKPIRHFSLVRNEVKTLASARSAQKWMQSHGGFFSDQDRTQRFSLVLKDVCYIIKAEIKLASHATDPLKKYTEIFNRRVRKGQCFAQPYLGTREFSAYFSFLNGDEQPINLNDDLGRMLFDMSFSQEKKGPVRYRHHDRNGATWVDGRARPKFFSARLEHGVLHIPPQLYDEV